MESLLPIPKNIIAKTIGNDIISVRPGETMNESINRHVLEQRSEKIKKIKERINNE